MAKPKQKRKVAESSEEHAEISSEEKVARALGLLLIKDIQSSTDQAAVLRKVGFAVADIADMLDMSSNYVSVSVYKAKKAAKVKAKKKAAE